MCFFIFFRLFLYRNTEYLQEIEEVFFLKYKVIDSLFERQRTWILNEGELLEQFNYLNCPSLEVLISELEEMGYQLFPVIES